MAEALCASACITQIHSCPSLGHAVTASPRSQFLKSGGGKRGRKPYTRRVSGISYTTVAGAKAAAEILPSLHPF